MQTQRLLVVTPEGSMANFMNPCEKQEIVGTSIAIYT